MLYGNWLQK